MKPKTTIGPLDGDKTDLDAEKAIQETHDVDHIDYKLSPGVIDKIIQLLQTGESIPESYKSLLFPIASIQTESRTRYEYRQQPETDGVRAFSDNLILLQTDKDRILQKLAEEMHGAQFGGLYFLIDSKKLQLYVGQTEDFKKRIAQHIKSPPSKNFVFQSVAVLWDGRPQETSRFNDNSLRLALEAKCVKVFRDGNSDYEPVNTQNSPPSLNVYQQTTVKKIELELLDLLFNFHLLKAIPEDTEYSKELTDRQVDELLRIHGFPVVSITGNVKVVTCSDGQVVYYRGGSRKPLGWQVTLRDTFLNAMLSGKSGTFFLLSREHAYLIPAEFFKSHLNRERGKLTIDFFIDDQRDELRSPGVRLYIRKYRIS